MYIFMRVCNSYENPQPVIQYEFVLRFENCLFVISV